MRQGGTKHNLCVPNPVHQVAHHHHAGAPTTAAHQCWYFSAQSVGMATHPAPLSTPPRTWGGSKMLKKESHGTLSVVNDAALAAPLAPLPFTRFLRCGAARQVGGWRRCAVRPRAHRTRKGSGSSMTAGAPPPPPPHAHLLHRGVQARVLPLDLAARELLGDHVLLGLQDVALLQHLGWRKGSVRRKSGHKSIHAGRMHL